MEKSLEHLEFIISNTGKTISHFHKSDSTNSQLLPIGMLERLLQISLTVRKLFPELKTNKYLLFSVAVLIRTIILDVLIILNLVTEAVKLEYDNKSKKEILDKISHWSNSILCDGISGTRNYIKMAGEKGLKSKDEIEKNLAGFIAKYAGCFVENDSERGEPKAKFNTKLNAFSIFEKLAGSVQTIDLAKVYDSYIFYSKFEHFSYMYFDMVNLSLELQTLQLKKSIEIFVGHQLNLHHLLYDCTAQDEFIKQQHSNALNYFNKLMA